MDLGFSNDIVVCYWVQNLQRLKQGEAETDQLELKNI